MVLKFMLPLKELESYRVEIDNYINEIHPRHFSKEYLSFVSGKIKYKNLSEDIDKSLSEPNWDMLDRPKSYLRPLIFLLLMGGLGKQPKDFVKYATILELIHNGTLIHDDIEDYAKTRRGDKPTYLKYGLDIAVNSANLMYFTPFLIFKKYSKELSDKIKLSAYEVLIEHLNRVTWGQGLDIYWHRVDKIPSIEDYLQMCCYKTGAIDRMVFSLAGVLAEVSETNHEILNQFGEKLGICLQLHDDFSDACSDDRKVIGGKDIGNDITEGKKSIVNIITLINLEDKDKRELLNILSEHTSDSKKIESALRLIEKSNSLVEVLDLAEREFNNIKETSSKILNEKYSKMMNLFIDAMIEDMKIKYSCRKVR